MATGGSNPDYTGSLYHIAASDCTATVVASGLTSPASLAVDASGSVFVAEDYYNGDQQFSRVDPDGTITLLDDLERPSAVVISPSGDPVVYARGEGALYSYDASGTQSVAFQTLGDPKDVAIGADGLAYVSGGGSVMVVDPDTAALSVLADGFDSPYEIALDANGNGNVYLAQYYDGVVMVAPDGTTTQLSGGISGLIGLEVVEIDGTERIFTNSHLDGTVYEIDAAGAGESIYALFPYNQAYSRSGCVRAYGLSETDLGALALTDIGCDDVFYTLAEGSDDLDTESRLEELFTGYSAYFHTWDIDGSLYFNAWNGSSYDLYRRDAAGSISLFASDLPSGLGAPHVDQATGYIYLTTGEGLLRFGDISVLDADADGIYVDEDNCEDVSNPLQEDVDGDGVGNACDVCPELADPEQEDSDGDLFGDACDTCPDVENPDQMDSDEDLFGDACDVCAYTPDDQADADGDLFGDACDVCPDEADPDQLDADGDLFGDACDVCPDVADADQVDADGDGLGDACDICPDDADADQADADADGIGDACDVCPSEPDADQVDTDGIGDACEDEGGPVEEDPEDPEGCGCASTPSPSGGLAFGLLLGLVSLRRRRS